jgi:hypothetical protein
MTLGEALAAELKDAAGGVFRGVLSSVNGADVARAFIAAAIIIVLAPLQVTVFSRFSPFGAVPDLMLCFTVAIAFSEGEKFGGICGLVTAFVIESLCGVGITLLPLLYMPIGFFGGVIARNMLGDTFYSRAAMMAAAAVGRAVVSLIYCISQMNISFGQAFTNIVVPEFFSTLVISPAVFILVWLCYRYFHKTRAEKTEKLK